MQVHSKILKSCIKILHLEPTHVRICFSICPAFEGFLNLRLSGKFLCKGFWHIRTKPDVYSLEFGKCQTMSSESLLAITDPCDCRLNRSRPQFTGWLHSTYIYYIYIYANIYTENIINKTVRQIFHPRKVCQTFCCVLDTYPRLVTSNDIHD